MASLEEEVKSMSAKLDELQVSLAEVLTLARQGTPASIAVTQQQAPIHSHNLLTWGSISATR